MGLGTGRPRRVLRSAAPTTDRPTELSAAFHRPGSLLHAIAAVAAMTDVSGVITAVVVAASELVDADEGAFAVLSSDGTVADLVQHRPAAGPAAAAAGQPVAVRDRAGLLAELIGAGDAIRLVDLTTAAEPAGV